VAGPQFRSHVEVSRAQIAANYRAVCQAVGEEVEVLGVVKADAYGHGAVEVSRVLEAEGARWLAVSSVDEGVTLRQAGIRARILVMGGSLRCEYAALREYRLTPALHSLEELRDLDCYCCANSEVLPYHLKIDSGLCRLGVRDSTDEILEAIRSARHARLEGLMTHLASAADYTSSQTDEQCACFERSCQAFREAGVRTTFIHMASTNALAYGRRESWHSMVRPGHAIYGYVSPARGPAPARVLHVEPALTWKASILLIKDLPEGALVGYGGSYRTPRPLRAGILAVGYADGMFHRLSNRGKVIAGGKFAPILGTVAMDLTTIDLSQAPHLKIGDEVTLLGREGDVYLDAQQIAKIAGTISYNILCSISARVKRVYV
jgi:alanine racemase